MFPQRQVLRSAPRFLRAPAQRRLMSAGPAKAGENAFIKERQAVKEHASESTGELTSGEQLDAARRYMLTDSILQRSGRRSPSSMTTPTPYRHCPRAVFYLVLRRETTIRLLCGWIADDEEIAKDDEAVE